MNANWLATATAIGGMAGPIGTDAVRLCVAGERAKIGTVSFVALAVRLCVGCGANREERCVSLATGAESEAEAAGGRGRGRGVVGFVEEGDTEREEDSCSWRSCCSCCSASTPAERRIAEAREAGIEEETAAEEEERAEEEEQRACREEAEEEPEREEVVEED